MFETNKRGSDLKQSILKTCGSLFELLQQMNCIPTSLYSKDNVSCLLEPMLKQLRGVLLLPIVIPCICLFIIFVALTNRYVKCLRQEVNTSTLFLYLLSFGKPSLYIQGAITIHLIKGMLRIIGAYCVSIG